MEITYFGYFSKSKLYKCKNLFTFSVIRELYFTLKTPLLEYASPVFLQDVDKLEKCQAVQFVVNNYSCHASVSEMIYTVKWPSLEQRRYQLQPCLFYI